MAKRPIKRSSGPFDIRTYKKDLRVKYRGIRTSFSLEERKEKDEAIFAKIRQMPSYIEAPMVLCYVSTPEEIATHQFILQCLADGKTVGVPYCISGTREMDFYKIEGLDQLERRTFGVLEPVPERCEKLVDFSNSICILPGVSFDKAGYRLGYGGGYYDRFLSGKYNGKTKVGVCYHESFRDKLIHGRYDRPADYIVTQFKVHKRRKPRRRSSGKQHNRK